MAKIVPFEDDGGRRIGLAEGKLPMLSSIEDFNSIDLGDELVNGGAL